MGLHITVMFKLQARGSHSGDVIKQILLPRGDMRYGCPVGVFEERSILFRS
jgi:hypothetical protein